MSGYGLCKVPAKEPKAPIMDPEGQFMVPNRDNCHERHKALQGDFGDSSPTASLYCHRHPAVEITIEGPGYSVHWGGDDG